MKIHNHGLDTIQIAFTLTHRKIVIASYQLFLLNYLKDYPLLKHIIFAYRLNSHIEIR